ncbi:hypothetical protein [Methanoregula sp.]|jgi:hypothetical protein|uniref:hypothetical protein n=1 Tax=Methanoregula sp. TaxID=2052170 RepID=UPI00260614CF|nr:hypothetical protein [Methanoregula sp.]MDD5144178.1 hypothetical protein [Methanoregula sp.]
MKKNSKTVVFSILNVFFLVIVCIIAGCTSPASSGSSTPATTVTADIAVATPQVTASPTSSLSEDEPFVPPNTEFLTYGVTVTVPSNWEKEIPEEEDALRDYGRVTTNIANFYSPDVPYLSKRWNQSQPNIDKSNYTVMSIDVDPGTVTDFEQYFNLATLALQNTYGHITITKHNYQLKISGYDAYKLDFDTSLDEKTDMRASYIFTDVDGTIYIFAFKNPSLYSSEVEEIYKSAKIVSVVPTKKSR